MRYLFLVASFFCFFSSWASSGGCCNVSSPSGGMAGFDADVSSIPVSYTGSGSGINLGNIVSAATSSWNSSCGGSHTPSFTSGSGGLEVELVNENSEGHLGEYSQGLITLYTHDNNGRQFSSSDLTNILIHELGHAHGLGDISESGCLMGPASRDTFGNVGSKSVTGDDCNKVDRIWQYAKLDIPDPNEDPCGPIKQKAPAAGDCNSPILVDLDRNGFHLGEFNEGVWFDLLGVGEPRYIQWVAAGREDAFLMVDWNGNGLVDDGSELFGNGSRLWLEGGVLASDGFKALTQYDHPDLGGNADGMITSADDIWVQLALWVDANADAVCEPSEMRLLEEMKLDRFETAPKRRGQRDSNGNLMTYWSWAYDDDTRFPFNRYRTVDVFFRTPEE